MFMKELLNDLMDWINGLFEPQKQPIPVKIPVRNSSNYPAR